MSEETSFLANPEVSMRKEEAGRALLYNSDTGTLTLINHIGWIIWKYLQDDPRTKTEIVAQLKDASDNVPAEHAEADVEGFLKDLLDKGFIGEVMDELSDIRFKAREQVEEETVAETEKVADSREMDTLEGRPIQLAGNLYPYRGSSMKGTFKPGDFLETTACKLRNLRRGDVIIFKESEAEYRNNPIVHRIVRIGRDGFITQGDNNKRPDARPVPANSIMGKVVLRERAGVHRRVIGGWRGLIKAKTAHYLRMAIRGFYSRTGRLWPKRLIAIILRPLTKSPVREIRISTKEGHVVKWVWRKRTVAVRHGENNPLLTSLVARSLIDAGDVRSNI